MAQAHTIDAADIARFDQVAATWWDPDGPFKPLHRLNPARLAFLRRTLDQHFGSTANTLRPLAGKRLLDAGCGGGLIAEPMARLGAAVTGLDASAEALTVARAHAAAQGLAIDYRQGGIEDVDGPPFDVILALEVIEHVADPDAFLGHCRKLLAPGGILIVSTLNRTSKSFALGIVAAEYLLRWLPRGTHDWKKFLKPSELAAALRRAGLSLRSQAGLVYNPLTGQWKISDTDLSVNYFAVAVGA
jgi:2-polyprenyl-6-hydroxyphenyl methylase/3-demethylubiquinone-9 3-methyltransferase